MVYKPKKDKIPTWAIVVGFMFGFWPGGILLAIRMIQEAEEKDNGKARRTDREWEQNAREASRQSRTYNAQGQRTYQPPKADAAREERTIQGGMNADGTYRYSYSQPKTTAADRPVSKRATVKPAPSLLQDKRLSAKIGRGLKLAGNIVMGVGAIIAALAFFSELYYGMEWLWDAVMLATPVALTFCVPGAVLSYVGGKKHSRVMRCRTYAAMIGSRRSVSIDDLAAAIPTGYSKCVDDLQWMLGEGLLQGMYIDGSSRTLTYPDAGEAEKAATGQQPQPAQTADGEFPEVARIRALNAHITDDYVSQRMDRLEELTQKILSYTQEHPEKEPNLRQFRNHYLPKTFSILESYARMERMGVEGGNIGSAMKDVEDIMDKLVLGFEKQLDALFDSEAMDVTTDVSVLENMMNLEGLSDLDPFGAASRRDAGETWEKN